MRAAVIEVKSSVFNVLLRLRYRGELVHVQTLVSQSSVKRFNKGISHGFPRSNVTRHSHAHLQHRTLPAPGIDDRENPKRSSVGQGIMQEFHTPALGRSMGVGAGPRCLLPCETAEVVILL